MTKTNEHANDFSQWLDKLVEDKELDLNHNFHVNTKLAVNVFPLHFVIRWMKALPANERQDIKEAIEVNDFSDDEIMMLFETHAEAISF